MSSQQFQATYDQIQQLGTNLLSYFRELRVGKLSEGDQPKRLQFVEDNINTALNALKVQKYQVAVIAAMKAGKSTFLNVLIGADILASESESCTVCRTDIKPIDHTATPRLLEYREGERKPIVIAEGDASHIRHQFLTRTRQIRSNKNPDKTVKFELEHPIEAISKLPSLNGFTLVDTPGPNEWQSAEFNTIALKRTALEALRTCDAILFILDYSSFRDDTNSELLKELIEQRQEALKENTGKLFFILNKVDRKAEKDRPIENVVEDLRTALIGFGIPEPIIYPASSWQGLLAKLIQNKVATQEHKTDFKNFFIARYMKENEEGDLYVPKMPEIAPQALIDSYIPALEESVIQTVVKNSGWNLLSDVLNKLDKASKAIEDSLNTQIQGWEIEFEALKKKIEEYQEKSKLAKIKVESIKNSITLQKENLIRDFSEGIDIFADQSKSKIVEEINGIANNRSPQTQQRTTTQIIENRTEEHPISNIINRIGDIAGNILESFPIPFGRVIAQISRDTGSLVDNILRSIPGVLDTPSILVEETEIRHFDAFVFRFRTQEEAKQLLETINNYCSPHLQDWWLYTQDELIRYGTQIRQQLVEKIQKDIQSISDELSDYLGESLQIQLNINPIQFPDFNFQGIDSKIEQTIEDVTVIIQESRIRSKGFCKENETYTIDVPIEQKQEYYIVNLRRIADEVQHNISIQAQGTQQILKRVIQNQVDDDFRNAEKQINDYIQKFQDEFDNLLKQRKEEEADAPRILAMLDQQKVSLMKYLSEINQVRQSLDAWKPNKYSILA